MNVKVAVVILNYNGKADTLECLASVYRSVNVALFVILIDNGSTDDSVKAVRQAYPGVAVVENAQNLGFAAGSNQGIRKAFELQAEYIVLLNNDTVIAPEALGLMAGYLQSDKSIGSIGPLIFYWGVDTRVWSSGGRIDWIRGLWTNNGDTRYTKGLAYDVDALSGCCLMIPAEVLRECGLLEEKLFLYGEDTDLCIRIGKSGRRIVCFPPARVWHKVGQTMGGSDSVSYIYYNVRNRLYFMKKYSHPLARFVFFVYFVFSIGSRYIYYLINKKPDKAGALIKGTGDFLGNRYGRFREEEA
jgi:GT2 family glycosyltransferase